MDPLTQGMLGAAASAACFAHKLPRTAWLVGLAGGMAADLDVFFPRADPLIGMAYHRHFTHALAFIPVGGLIVAGVFLAIGARRYAGNRWWVLAAATLAYATHGLLDACTAYGTVLWWPFSEARVSWDFIAIVDPLFTVPLVVGVVWTVLAVNAGKRRAAAIGLSIALTYMCFGAFQHHRAISAQERLAASRDHNVVRGRAMPTLGNLIVWRSLYEADGRLWADAVRLPVFGAAQARSGQSLARVRVEQVAADHGPELLEAMRVLDWFADGYLAYAPQDQRVVADMRYSVSSGGFEPLWGLLIAPGRTAFIGLHGLSKRRLSDLWREIAKPAGSGAADWTDVYDMQP